MKQLIEGASLVRNFTPKTLQSPPRLVDLNLFLHDFFNYAQSSLGRDQYLQLFNCCSGLAIYSDSKFLRQVLCDLLIFVAHSASNAGTIRLEIMSQDNHVIFLVQSVTRDCIHRNSPRERELVRPVDESTRVSGAELKLASLKRYADALGGQISLESDGREGTSFRVTLPLHPPSTRR